MIIRNNINSTLIAFIILMLCYSDAYTQTGPGGIGSSASNILWLKADAITGLNNDDPVATWPDYSGNSNNLTQGTAIRRPVYKTNEINGKPIIRFDGSNDHFIRNPFTGFATAQITAIVVNKNNGEVNDGIISYASTASDNNFLLYNSSSVNIYRNGNINTSTVMNDNNFHIGCASWRSAGGTARYYKDGNQTYSGTISSGVSVTSGGSLVIAEEQDAVGGGFDASQAHAGDFAEVILFNYFLNDAQIIIVQNYLAAKYLISLTVNDYYAYETTHGNEVAGIGRVDASNTHTDAKSAEILEISNPLGLSDNEYLLFGHDNNSISSWTTTEIPAGDIIDARRIEREWRLDETGDVGTVTITLDATLFPAPPAGFSQYGFWIDSDGDFSIGSVWYPLADIGSNQYQTTGINITTGDFITFGIVRPKIQFTLSADDDFETTPSVNIEISLNYFLSGNTTVDYNITGGTAIGGGTDYTLANGTATILAGSTVTNITITLTNDITVESDETVIITLSNPSAGVILGTNTIHTFTIHDDDNPRKIDFALASSNGDESITPVVLTIQINIADGVNPTTVDYSVTGGTATGGGVDYTLASGTATILPTFTTTTISFTVNDDILDEANETLIISLTNPTNSNIGTNITHTYTINDNDAPPTVQFSVTNSSGSESVSPVNIQVDLSSVSGQDISVDYSVTGGTATGGGVDYTLTSGTLNILAGNINGNINAFIINDAFTEIDETIIITLSNPVNASLGAINTHTYTILDNDPFGYTGPGGVGSTSNNVLWLKADAITGLSDGNDVTSWPDVSGNSNTIIQSNTSYTPRYYSNIINSKPVVRWEQADTRIRKTSFNNMPATSITSIIVNRNNDNNDGLISYASTASDNDYLLFNSANATKYRASSNDASGQVLNGNVWRIITTTWQQSGGGPWFLYRNGTQNFSGNVGAATTITTGGCMAIGAEQDGVDGGYSSAQSHNGDIAEVIIYGTVLNTAQRIVVENYLSSKYSIAIANDRFLYDATHGNEVAGIGRINATNFHLDAQGTSIVRINNPSGLDDNDFLLWGHDNASNSIPNTTDVPAGIDNRMNRVWRADKTNDVGTVTVSFDLTGFTVNSGNDLELLIDGDGVFTNATRYTTGRTWNPPIISFTLVNFSDGDYFTIASNNSSTPLPVELLNFEATCNKEKIDIVWSTASEINNNYFSIERSIDAINWSEIASISGAGNSVSTQFYSYTDFYKYYSQLYYRLKQTDYDGNYKYSQTISINNCNEEITEINIYPNPSKGIFNINISDGEEQVRSIYVYNAEGIKVYYSDRFQSILDLTEQPNGIYFVHINFSYSNFSKIIVIQCP